MIHPLPDLPYEKLTTAQQIQFWREQLAEVIKADGSVDDLIWRVMEKERRLGFAEGRKKES